MIATRRKLLNASTMSRSKGLLNKDDIVQGRAEREMNGSCLNLIRGRDLVSVDPLPYRCEMAEHKAMILCTSALTTLLQHNLLSVSSKLLARGLITDEVSVWMLTAQGVSDLSKAQRLVSCVSDRVKGSPQRFQSFVDVLSGEAYFEEVVQKLITTYNNSGIALLINIFVLLFLIHAILYEETTY